MKAMIFAAGLGSRLKPFTDNAPKALAIVAGKTLLQHAITYLQRYGIFDVIINVHHFAPMIEQTLLENNGFGSIYVISDERNEILETGGGLKKAAWFFENETAFVAVNVDIITTLDLGKMIFAHQFHAPDCTLAVMNRGSGRQLLFDDAMKLCGWKNNTNGEVRMSRECLVLHPFAFSGVQIVSNKIWKGSKLTGKFSLIDLYLEAAGDRTIFGYDHSGDKFIDVGKPGSVEQAEKLLFN